jgi:hypothetical protein
MKYRVGPKLLAAALIALFGVQVPGCQQCDTTGQDPILFTEGITDPTRTTYETTPINGTWLHFPPGRIFDLRHNLRGPVLAPLSYVSFKARLTPDEDEDDTSMDNPNNFSESAGNQVVFEEPDEDKEHTIRVRNDTCSEFYIRIVATTAPGAGQMSLGGAAGAGGADLGGAGGAAP